MALKMFSDRIPGQEHRNTPGIQLSELADEQEQQENFLLADPTPEDEEEELDLVQKKRKSKNRLDEGLHLLNSDY